MATTYDKASLVMIPSGYKDDKLFSIKPTDGSGDFTFSRDGAGASPATRVNASGYIEKGRTNEVKQSQNFADGAWIPAGFATKTSGQTDPFGGNTATRIVSTAVLNSGIYQVDATNFGTNNIRTASLWMKGAVGGEQVELGDATNRKVVTLTTSWVRYETFAIDASAFYIVYSNGLAQTWDIAFAQYEDGLVATDYIETTTAAVSAGLLGDMPRLDYSGGATCPSLLLEPSRVNKLSHSEYFGAWSASNVTLDFGYLAPDGTNSAYKVTDNTSGNLLISGVTDADDTRSIYARAVSGTGTAQLLSYFGNTNNVFTLTEEWQRFDVTGVTDSTGETNFYAVDFRGSGTLSEVLIWGAQVEAASYPTSYIPTYGSASTRGADFGNDNDLVDTAIAFGANDDFTFFYEGQFKDLSADTSMILGGGRYQLGNDYKSYLWARPSTLQINGVAETLMASASHSISDNTNTKILVKRSGSVISFFVDGVKLTTTQNTTNTAFTFRSFGWSYTNAVYRAVGNAKQLLIFPTALTDAECIALTTI